MSDAAYYRRWRAALPEHKKEAQRQYNRNWYARNPGYRQRWSRRNPVRTLFQITKERAKLFKIPFELTLDDVIALCAPMRCQITGHKLSWGKSTKTRYHPWQPSLDQRKPRGGYTKRNTRVVSLIYNFCKGRWTDATVAQFRTAP